MANLLDKNKQHLFTEKQNNKNNSFIANVNKLVSKFEELVRIDSKFTVDDVALLVQLAKNELDINIREVASDLRKGSYNGYRKLDINLLTNFKDYSYTMTEEEQRELWSDPAHLVYYERVTVYFSDSSSITKKFDTLVTNHRQLFDEFSNWDEFEQRAVNTSFNIIPNTPIFNHELLRFWDSNLETSTGSNVDSIVLHVAPQGQNTDYDAVFFGANSTAPLFTWVDTTSALVTMANRINEIIYTANYIEQVGSTFVQDLQNILAAAENARDTASIKASESAASAAAAEASFQKQVSFKVTSTPVPVDESPRALYAPSTNTLELKLPTSEVAVVGLSQFAVDVANGHLSFTISNEKDVESVYVDDSTGNVIIEMKK